MENMQSSLKGDNKDKTDAQPPDDEPCAVTYGINNTEDFLHTSFFLTKVPRPELNPGRGRSSQKLESGE